MKMNRIIKFGIASIALAAAAPSFAQENEESEAYPEGAKGWTPVALGIATPVQLPWGNRWDVFGLDLNLFYSDAPKMYGLDIAGLAAVTREDMRGMQVSGLFNFGLKDVYGIRATLGLNMCAGTVYGFDAGLIGFRNELKGLDIHFLGSASRNLTGLAIGGIANVVSTESYGCTIAGVANVARTAYGLQAAIIYNMTDELHGCQIALVNFADYCPNGFQIGLVNIIMSNTVKVLPFVNGYF